MTRPYATPIEYALSRVIVDLDPLITRALNSIAAERAQSRTHVIRDALYVAVRAHYREGNKHPLRAPIFPLGDPDPGHRRLIGRPDAPWILENVQVDKHGLLIEGIE